MPQWGWIIIFATAVPLVVLITCVILKRGGSIGIGKNTLTIPSGEALVVHGDNRESEGPMGKALHYVPDNIGQIHNLIYGRYLKLVKAKGVDAADITNIEDSRFARSLIKNATSLGNGSRSVQKILETHIARRDFLGKDVDLYVCQHVLPRVIDAVREVVNSEYDSVVHYAEGSTRDRIVSQVEFVDMLLSREFRDLLTTALVPFFEYASDCLDGEGKP